MREPDDSDLVASINRGEQAAFEQLYRRYRDWVVSLSTRYGADREESLDVLQETFAYVASKVPGLALRAKFTTFLFPVVKHLTFERRRKANRHPGLLEEVDIAAPDAQNAELGDLEAVVARLPDGQREALLLRFVDGLSMDEIAEALSIPAGTVKSRLHHAIKALRGDKRTAHYFEDKE